jgi:hypothetical protein
MQPRSAQSRVGVSACRGISLAVSLRSVAPGARVAFTRACDSVACARNLVGLLVRTHHLRHRHVRRRGRVRSPSGPSALAALDLRSYRKIGRLGDATPPARRYADTPSRDCSLATSHCPLLLRAPSYLPVVVFRPAAQRLARKRRAHLRKRVRIIRLKEGQ